SYCPEIPCHTSSMPAEFLSNLPKNLTTHLTHKLYAVFPIVYQKSWRLSINKAEKFRAIRCRMYFNTLHKSTKRAIIKETLHKARLTALHAICLQIFRHIAQKSLAIHQVCLRNFCAICRKI
ncbi:hypothetical protein, partial [uncultured Ruminococcus sp.]|uniref:hypothetical protein n=1 Tax=uncultured Ruminococcus sp. TaxID=165186 RepID=UPI0026708B24